MRFLRRVLACSCFLISAFSGLVMAFALFGETVSFPAAFVFGVLALLLGRFGLWLWKDRAPMVTTNLDTTVTADQMFIDKARWEIQRAEQIVLRQHDYQTEAISRTVSELGSLMDRIGKRIDSDTPRGFTRVLERMLSQVDNLIFRLSDVLEDRVQQAPRSVSENSTETNVRDVPLQLTYRDSKGRVTDRQIKVRKVATKDGILHVTGTSEGSKGIRTFRADRIRQIIDPATGEFVDQNIGQWLAWKLNHPY